MNLMKNQNSEPHSVYTKVQELIKKYPGTFGVAAFALFLFVDRLSGTVGEGQNDAKPKAPAVTATPF